MPPIQQTLMQMVLKPNNPSSTDNNPATIPDDADDRSGLHCLNLLKASTNLDEHMPAQRTDKKGILLS